MKQRVCETRLLNFVRDQKRESLIHKARATETTSEMVNSIN